MTNEEKQKYIDAISTKMRSIAEECDENLQFEYDVLRLALAALTAQPVKLPGSFSPDISVFGADARCVMRADKEGRWVNRAAVELSIRAAGYEVQE